VHARHLEEVPRDEGVVDALGAVAAGEAGRAALRRNDPLERRAPGFPMVLEGAPAVAGEPVEAALALAGLLDPSPLDQAAILEAQKRRIGRRQGKGEPPAGMRLDQLADLVAVVDEAGPGMVDRPGC
jgi:hypothetical protein